MGERTRSMRSARARRPWRIRAVGVFVAAAVCGGVASAVALSSESETPIPADGGIANRLAALGVSIAPLPPGAPVISDGKLVSLEEAGTALGEVVLLPSDQLASKDNLNEVWANEETGDVAVTFKSGITIYYTVWRSTAASTPSEFYATQAKESGVGEARLVGGDPAYVVAADAQTEGFPPDDVVDLTVGDQELSIHGEVGVDALLRVASSVDS
jgi:hypothetical protein